MSRYFKCPECNEHIEGTMYRVPLCENCKCEAKEIDYVPEVIENQIGKEDKHKRVFVCPICNRIERFVGLSRGVPYCDECDCYMDRVSNQQKLFNIGDKEYFHPLHSDSLAIMPSQVEEHKKMFPGVGLDSECRPIFTSVKQHDDYMDKTGVVKQTQKIKPKGKRIA